jgi:hypothetical protein
LKIEILDVEIAHKTYPFAAGWGTGQLKIAPLFHIGILVTAKKELQMRASFCPILVDKPGNSQNKPTCTASCLKKSG